MTRCKALTKNWHSALNGRKCSFILKWLKPLDAGRHVKVENLNKHSLGKGVLYSGDVDKPLLALLILSEVLPTTRGKTWTLQRVAMGSRRAT